MEAIDKNLIDAIKKAISDLHSNDEDAIKKYSLKIHKILHRMLFVDLFGEKYLYSTLLFVKNKNILEHDFLFAKQEPDKYNGAEHIRKYVKTIQPNLAKKIRLKEETIGISNQLIQSNNTSLVLYNTLKQGVPEHKIRVNNEISLAYNLQEVNISEKEKEKIYECGTNRDYAKEVSKGKFYENFIKNGRSLNKLKEQLKIKGKDISLLKPIITLYAIGKPKSVQNYYVYFIKPSTKQKYYDGLINIALTEPPKEGQLFIIDLILFYIFSEIAIKELNLKNEEELHIELAHSINSDLGNAIGKLKNSLNKETSHKDRIIHTKDAQELIKKVYSNGRALLLLDKKNKDKIPFEYVKFDVGLISNNLKNSLFNNRRRFPNVMTLDFINSTIDCKTPLNNLFLVEESYDLLLYNVINNAVTHTKNNIDKLKIHIHEHKRHLSIKVFNDGLIKQNIYESINNNFISLEGFSYGLRTISKIHNTIPEISVFIKTNIRKRLTCFIIKINKRNEK